MENKMKARLQNQYFFTPLIHFLSKMTDNIFIQCSSDGWKIQTLDSIKVAIANITLNANEIFSNYECAKSTTFCVDSSYFFAILKKTLETDTIDFVLTEILTISINNSHKSFDIKLIDTDPNFYERLEEQEQKVCRFVLSSSQIKQIDTFCTSIDDNNHVEFIIQENKLMCRVQNDFITGTLKIILQPENFTNNINDENDDDALTVKFLKKYWSILCSLVSPISKNFEIILQSTSYPIEIVYQIAPASKIAFFIAPCVDDYIE